MAKNYTFQIKPPNKSQKKCEKEPVSQSEPTVMFAPPILFYRFA
jgi:hypothetical protein